MTTPPHYNPGTGVTPWDLQKNMRSTGDVFIDSRRTDAIEYAYRIKDDPPGDWRKAAHCLLEAADRWDDLHPASPHTVEIEWHNPEKIPLDRIGNDWRLLLKAEVVCLPLDAQIMLGNGDWVNSVLIGTQGKEDVTYRTKEPLPEPK